MYYNCFLNFPINEPRVENTKHKTISEAEKMLRECCNPREYILDTERLNRCEKIYHICLLSQTSCLSANILASLSESCCAVTTPPMSCFSTLIGTSLFLAPAVVNNIYYKQPQSDDLIFAQYSIIGSHTVGQMLLYTTNSLGACPSCIAPESFVHPVTALSQLFWGTVFLNTFSFKNHHHND